MAIGEKKVMTRAKKRDMMISGWIVTPRRVTGVVVVVVVVIIVVVVVVVFFIVVVGMFVLSLGDHFSTMIVSKWRIGSRKSARASLSAF